MAHKKGQTSSRNGRESASKRLGVKIWGGQKITAGNIIVRQRGNKHFAGEMILCMLLLTVLFTSTRVSSTRAQSLYFPLRSMPLRQHLRLNSKQNNYSKQT